MTTFTDLGVVEPITSALAKRQRSDGSWINDNHWLEADPNLVTGYALMALVYCKPKTLPK